jgi:hypothetical protein
LRAAVALTALAACTSELEWGDGSPSDGTITGPPDTVDFDHDGVTVQEGDCDDNNELVALGFAEFCDNLDNDCGGIVDWDDTSIDPETASACASLATFEQTLQVDVLFVVDTTATMIDYLSNLAVGAYDVLKALAGEPYLDSHIGVVDMEMGVGGGELLTYQGSRYIAGSVVGDFPGAQHSWSWAQDFLSSTIAAPQTAFTDPWARGVVSLATSPELADGVGAPNAGFVRSGAHLVLVFLTSDEDQTLDPTVDAFEAELTLLKGSLSELTMHGIVQDGELDCDGNSKPEQKGYSYERLAQDTAGTILSICEQTSYSGFFEAMGQNSAYEGLETEFPLYTQAQPDGIEVTVVDTSGNERPLYDFALADGNTTLVITADPPPSAGALIQVEFERVPD